MKIFIIIISFTIVLFGNDISGDFRTMPQLLEEYMSTNIMSIISMIFLMSGFILFLINHRPSVLFISILCSSVILLSSKMFTLGMELDLNDKTPVALNETKTFNPINTNKEPNVNIVNNGTANINFNTYNGPVTIIYDKK